MRTVDLFIMRLVEELEGRGYRLDLRLNRLNSQSKDADLYMRDERLVYLPAVFGDEDYNFNRRLGELFRGGKSVVITSYPDDNEYLVLVRDENAKETARYRFSPIDNPDSITNNVINMLPSPKPNVI